MERPTTSYAWNEGTALAYQVVGKGPDLLLVPGSATHVEMLWEEPRAERFLIRLASFCRLILMDPRGLGLSDRLSDVPTLDERVSDLLAVLDAASSETATLFGNADTGPPCIAATVAHPSRVDRLILCGTYAKGEWSADYPIGWTGDDFGVFEGSVRTDWADAERVARVAPSMAEDRAFKHWAAALMRAGASPRAMVLLAEMTRSVDVRELLRDIAVPTLVLHRRGDRINPAEHGRYLAERIRGARWVELPGEDFLLWAGDTDSIVNAVEEFITGRRTAAPTRIVATVMFTDIVASTEHARSLGDRAWADLVEAHNTRVRAELHRFGGQEVDSAGDGFFARLPSPSSAIACAKAAQRSVADLGIRLRVGIHTGECDVLGDRIRGIAIHIGARIVASAPAGEILVSQTVKDLLIGSGIEFTERGAHELKGVPGEWNLYSVKD